MTLLALSLSVVGCDDEITPPNGTQPVASVSVAPDSAEVTVGASRQFTATVRDSAGNVLSSRSVSWASSDVAVAAVDSTGLVTGLTLGAAVIIASSDGIDGEADVVVVAMPPGSVTMEPDTVVMVEGDTARLVVTVRDTSGAIVVDREVEWTTSDSAVAMVDSTGLVAGVGIGVATITATVEGVSGIAALTVTPLIPFGLVSTGVWHVCATSTAGSAYCWRANDFGQLGDGTTTSSATPVAVSGGLSYGSVNVGEYHTCGVVGSVGFCWGNNASGRLGVASTGETCGSTPCSTTPETVSGGLSFTSVVAGKNHSCGLTTGGDAYCWGLNNFGQIGNDTTTETSQPTRVSTVASFDSLTALDDHTCGLDAGGRAFCWGKNSSGQLGDSTTASRTTPVLVKGGHDFRGVSAGGSHTCGVTQDNQAYCWGKNSVGQLGDGTQSNSSVPSAVGGGHSFLTVSAGSRHSCGVTPAGSVYCWGEGSSGQLGNGMAEDSTTPVLVSGGLTFESVSAGFTETCGTTTLGGLYCWGNNVLTPIRVPNPE